MHISAASKRVVRILVGGMLVVFSLGVHSDSVVTPGSKAAGLDACVAPTPDIRRNHMDYLKHDRDKTVHEGVRGIRNSLAGCVSCHAAQDDRGGFKPVNDEAQFCAGCHAFMAVNLTCFQCHRSIPEGDGSATADAGHGSPGLTHTADYPAQQRLPTPAVELSQHSPRSRETDHE